MSIVKAVLLVILIVGLAGCAGTSTGMRTFPAADGGHGPGTSFPQVYMNENGDRVGHYAPYFYPDH
jgi:hypothetical protein